MMAPKTSEVVCHAPGERCLGCQHKHGKEEVCHWAGNEYTHFTNFDLELEALRLQMEILKLRRVIPGAVARENEDSLREIYSHRNELEALQHAVRKHVQEGVVPSCVLEDLA